MKGEVLVESLAIWVIAVLLAIHGGWGQNGFAMLSYVELAVAIVLLVAVLMFTAREPGVAGLPGMFRRLVRWWAVGSGWVFAVWFLSWGPLAPRGLLRIFFVIGLVTGFLIMGALGLLAALILVLVPSRTGATAIMFSLEVLMLLLGGFAWAASTC